MFYTVGYDLTVYAWAAYIVGLAAAVAISWSTTAWAAMKSGGTEGWALLGFALFMIAVFAIAQRSTAVTNLITEDWLDRTALVAFPPVILSLVLTTILLAPETQGGVVGKKNWVWWAGAGFIGGLFLGITLAMVLRPPGTAIIPASGKFMSPSVDQPTLRCTGEARPILVKAYCRRASTP